MKTNLSRIMLMASILAAMAFTSFSCTDDKDDDYQSSDMIGEWFISHINEYGYYEGKRVDFEASYTETETPIVVEVDSDGTGILDYTISPMITYMYGFEWSVKRDKITFKIEIDREEVTEVFTIRDLTSTTLKIQTKGVDEEGPYEHNYTLTKVKYQKMD